MSKSKEGVSETGSPRRQYKIPYVSTHDDDINSNWYIILTSTNRHFYFNASLRQSYWQLSDLKELFFKDEDGLQWDRFLDSFEFEVLGLLFAENIGFYVKDTQVRLESNIIKHGDIEVDIVRDDEPEVGNEMVIESEDDEGDSTGKEVDADLIRQLLQEEGYLNEGAPPVETEEVAEDSAVKQAGGLNLGYSSSEEEDEEEKEEKEVVEDDDEPPTINDGLDVTLSDSDENINEGLDLSIDDEDDATGNTGSKKDDFIKLLEEFKSKISIYDSWLIVEEDLINEFVKYPGYYAIEDSKLREDIFNEWVINQDSGVKADVEVSETQEGQDDEEEEVQQIENEYPTPTLEFYHLLQQFKSEVKSLVYQQFYTRHFRPINEISLSSKDKDSKYRKFKMMLSRQSSFEKEYKKSNPNHTNNLKKLKLDKYLIENVEKLSSSLNAFKVIQAEFSEKSLPSDDEHFYHKWIEFINAVNIDSEIVEDCMNFVVGDVKRLQCYIDFYNRLC